MLILLVAHAIMALIAPALVTWFGRKAFLVVAAAPAGAAVYALTMTSRVLEGNYPAESYSWIPALGINIAFRLDTLSWLMLLIVGGIGAGVLIYCSVYFSPTAQGLRRFCGVLTAFAGVMVGLVLADDLMLLFMFWELTTVFSYLLIGHYFEKKASRRAAMQAIIVTTAGGLAMLVGVVILGVSAETGFSLSGMIANPPQSAAVTAGVVCLLIGAASKAALIPTHFWLPGAMAAPTPVSAYLHAAAMVKAGVYLVARFAPAYSHLEVWVWMIVIMGCGTLLLGGYRALRQHDLKLILAYGTVSQLGLIVLMVGLGSQSAALAGLAMIASHAMFKAALFLTTGVVDAATGTRDMRRLTGVGRAMPMVAFTGIVATLSMIGVPPLAGYVAKEAALEALLHDGVPALAPWVSTVVLVSVVVGSMLTVAYGARFCWGAFADKKGAPAIAIPKYTSEGKPSITDMVDPAEFKRQGPRLTVPGLVLAVLSLIVGLFPAQFEKYIVAHADTYQAGHAGHLTLWAGFGTSFWLTVAVLSVGALMFWVRRPIELFQAAMPHGADAELVYRRFMRLLDNFAADLTAITQRGSLPYYLSAILVVMALGPGSLLFFGNDLPSASEVRLWDTPAQLFAVIIIIPAVVLAARSRRRIKAVLLVGFAGYSTAMLFLLQGAPDLALTQVLVETITLVVMLLALRRLPAYFSDRPLKASRWLRLSVALVIGALAMGLAAIVPGARIHQRASIDFPQEAYEFGGGKNIVNVALVDMRAWDTMGEISVLLVAATGVASLIFLSRRSGEILRVDNAPRKVGSGAVWSNHDETDKNASLRKKGVVSEGLKATPAQVKTTQRFRKWLRAGSTLAPQRRSVIFEVVARLVFHSMIVFGLFLLFSGHNAPGGGFAAGLVVGIALIVRYLAGGRYELGEAAPVHPGLLLGTGLFLSAGVGLLSLILSGSVLQSFIWEFTLPLIGDVKLISTLFFDIGVFLVVLGVVLDILRSLGAEIDKQMDTAATTERERIEEGAHR